MKTMSTDFSFEYQNDTLCIAVNCPQLDAGHVADFKPALDEAWKPSTAEVMVDLEKVGFIDSSGIGALLSIHKKFKDTDSNIHLLNVHPAVVSVIELLRLHRVFDIQAKASA